MPTLDDDPSSGPAGDWEHALGLPRVDKDRVLAGLFEDTAAREQTFGRFRVVGRLGQGGMGTVLEAYDPSLDRRIAIKVLHGLARARHQQRLLREAQALARLSHPHVVQVFETGEVGGQLFIAMELVRGRTLWEWQQAPHRWPELLEAYLQAGRGLAAAHAEGIVHRDFKPTNCIIDDARRVKVLDFGLARGLGDEQPSSSEPRALAGASPTSLSGLLDQGLTRTGTLLGTVAYMAPEQARRGPVDARADQYSFCVALYEAILGARPFEGPADTTDSPERESPSFLPAPSHAARPTAPTWLRRVLAQGMASDRQARFATMDALLDAIERHRRARRRRLAALALGLGLLVTVVTTRAMSDGARPSCELDRSALAGTWDDERRASVRAAFSGSGLPFADETFDATDDDLERWTDGWVDAQRRACEATRVQGIASDELLDRRTHCLDRRRRELEGVIEVLVRADPEVVARAPEVVATLAEPAACDDPPQADEAVRRSDDPDVVAAIALAQRRLAQGRALAAAGRLADARALAEQAERVAAEHADLPLELEAQALLAQARMNAGELDAGARELLTVIGRAERARLDALVAELRVDVAVRVAGAWSKPELEAVLLAQAEAWVDRTGLDHERRAHALARARAGLEIGAGQLEAALARVTALRDGPSVDEGDRYVDGRLAGQILAALGRLDEARVELDAARDLARRRWGEGSWRVAEVEVEVGLLELDRGNLDAADAELALAEQHYRAILGPEALDVARVRFRRAKLDLGRGELVRAHQALEAVLTSYARALGPDHFETGEVYNGLGVVRFFMGDLAGSAAAYRRALQIAKQARGELHEDVGLLYSNLGESLAAQGEHGAAIDAYRRALEILAVTVGPDHPLAAMPLKGHAQSLLARGQAGPAIPLLERALALHGDSAAEPLERADVQRTLALALAATGGDAARIGTLAREASATFVALGMAERAADLTALR